MSSGDTTHLRKTDIERRYEHQIYKMENRIKALKRKQKEQKRVNEHLLSALISMVEQHAYNSGDKNYPYITGGLSANEEAIYLLESLGKMKQYYKKGRYKFT